MTGADHPLRWDVSQRITVVGGDYSYEGYIVSIFEKKRGGGLRYVVEDDSGRLFIHNAKQVGREGQPVSREKSCGLVGGNCQCTCGDECMLR